MRSDDSIGTFDYNACRQCKHAVQGIRPCEQLSIELSYTGKGDVFCLYFVAADDEETPK